MTKEFDDTTSIVNISAHGFSLGLNLSDSVKIIKTFVSWDMVLPHQKELFDKLRAELKELDIKYNMMEFYKN